MILVFPFRTHGNYYDTTSNLYIDNKKVLALKEHSYSWDVVLCKVASKRTLFYLGDHSDSNGMNVMSLYEYKNGKLKSLSNLINMTRVKTPNGPKPAASPSKSKPMSSPARGVISSVGKNKITIRWSDYTKSATALDFFISYSISGNKVKMKKAPYKTTVCGNTKRKPIWTAIRSIKTYTKPGGNKASFTVKSGDKVNITKYTFKNGKRYLRLTNSKGKHGWYRDPDKYTREYFKEITLLA